MPPLWPLPGGFLCFFEELPKHGVLRENRQPAIQVGGALLGPTKCKAGFCQQSIEAGIVRDELDASFQNLDGFGQAAA